MDTVNKKLTRSSGHRADFNRRRERANVQRKLDGLPQLKALLSGHGIRWGIQAERWERMWAARDVCISILSMLFITWLVQLGGGRRTYGKGVTFKPRLNTPFAFVTLPCNYIIGTFLNNHYVGLLALIACCVVFHLIGSQQLTCS
jgi:hypothetical protein